MIIGLSGVAGSGKDTFYQLLAEQTPCVRISLADALKLEVNPWTLEHYGIDSTTSDREDKEKIREFLVFHGLRKREATAGRHWIEKAQEKIRAHTRGKYLQRAAHATIVITDIRYDDYPSDEVSWLKDELFGKLVHISQWHWFSDVEEGARIKKYILPANAEEERNDPKLKAKADYLFEAQKIESTDEEEIKGILRPQMKEFIQWMSSA